MQCQPGDMMRMAGSVAQARAAPDDGQAVVGDMGRAGLWHTVARFTFRIPS